MLKSIAPEAVGVISINDPDELDVGKAVLISRVSTGEVLGHDLQVGKAQGLSNQRPKMMLAIDNAAMPLTARRHSTGPDTKVVLALILEVDSSTGRCLIKQ
jgi:hypothetical protein